MIISWASRRGWAQTWLLAVFTAAVVLGPLEQARLHTLASLNKHVGLGAWFGAIAAGYAVDRFIAAAPAGRAQAVTCGACVVALAFPVTLGASQSRALAPTGPTPPAFIAILRPLADHGSGPYWSKTPPSPVLPARRRQWQRWSIHPQHHPAVRHQHRPPDQQGSVRRGQPRHLRPNTSAGATSPTSRSTSPTPPPWTIASPTSFIMTPTTAPSPVVPYGTEVPPLGQGTYVIWRYEPKR